jgi:hypothetical protein
VSELLKLMAMARKDGKLDGRTKEGKRAKQVAQTWAFLTSGVGRFIIGVIAFIILMAILGEKIPAFGEWLDRIGFWE